MSDRIEWADTAYNGPATIVTPAAPEPPRPDFTCGECGECDTCRDYDDAMDTWNDEPDPAADQLHDGEVAVVLGGTAWHGTPTQVRLTLTRALADLDLMFPRDVPTPTSLAAEWETKAAALDLNRDENAYDPEGEADEYAASIYRECATALARLA